MSKEHPFATFSKALEEAGLAKGSEKIKIGDRITNGQDALKAIPKAKAQGRMRLPSVLIEEAAKMVYSHWEGIAARAQNTAPLPWEELGESYRQEWRAIIGINLEMGIGVILKDAVQWLDQSNGDMGGAFSKALRRYMRERLDV